MDWITKLEKRFGGWAIGNLGMFLVLGQVVVFGAVRFGVFTLDTFYLNSQLVMQGEVWRLISFVFIPPAGYGVFFLIIYWMVFVFLSGALERQWGVFKFNLYIIIGIAMTLLVSPLLSHTYLTNHYISYTVLFAFATLYPNYEFMIMFILPVKVKWVAWLAFGKVMLDFFSYGAAIQLMIAVSLVNYTLFFGKDLLLTFKQKKRRAAHEKSLNEFASKAFHTCSVCGATDQSHPDREFRYKEGKGYCDVCVEKEEAEN